MLKYTLSYGIAAAAFLVLDALWLSTMAKRFYRPRLGDMLLDGFRTGPAVAFYLVFILGLVIFAIAPALAHHQWRTAATFGGLYGLFTYAAYNLTNWATLRHWSGAVAAVDITWGVTVSAASATLAYAVTRAVLK